MTNQEVYSKVRRHLLTQNQKALTPWTKRYAYRTPEGLTCAIGCLIPPERYSEDLEGKSAEAAIVLKAAGIAGTDTVSLVLLHDLQIVHDSYEPAQWKDRLTTLAIKHNLAIPQETI